MNTFSIELVIPNLIGYRNAVAKHMLSFKIPAFAGMTHSYMDLFTDFMWKNNDFDQTSIHFN